ncbi:HNH endonuclease [Marinobacterium weihaiense]|uniref:HNH endonuclease n=1 Tax=Marinobacterium weihaiense TaxID=2851016 RepID=A0ABS6MDM7_9GAMM|nr:HNH endonuclease [Marinobacterium weihaiense]MBV0934407.1 HNH endonuclease [Marinobacterium weihaiense]
MTNILKPCFRPPIAEIGQAAELLSQAVDAHLAGDRYRAAVLIRQADMPVIAQWIESIIGKSSPWVRLAPVLELVLPKEQREPARMPNAAVKAALLQRDGYHCRFCGIPVIRREIREKIGKAYPDALRWGKRNAERHAAFFAMWLQYDHLRPHSKGGGNELDNIAITCAACNYGRGGYSLTDVGLEHPFKRLPVISNWDGLERFE